MSQGFKDYDNLIRTTQRWLDRDDLDEEVTDFIWLAECDIQQTAQMRLRDAVFEGRIVKDQEYIDTPPDYVEGLYLRWDGNASLPPIQISGYDKVDTERKWPRRGNLQSTTTRSSFVHGDRIYFGVQPGADEPYTLFYRAGVQHLSSDNPTNLILQEYPDALLYGALVHSAPYLGADERMQEWATLYTGAKNRVTQQEWRARTGHGTLRMRPDVEIY